MSKDTERFGAADLIVGAVKVHGFNDVVTAHSRDVARQVDAGDLVFSHWEDDGEAGIGRFIVYKPICPKIRQALA